MHITLSELKDELEGEFLPLPVINKNHVVRSIRDAVRKYNKYKGFVSGVEKQMSKAIDLEEDQKVPRHVIEVFPDLSNIELSSLNAGQTQRVFHLMEMIGLTGDNEIDAQNKIVNWIQKRDSFETVKSLLGLQPTFELQGNTLYLDNYNQSANQVFIIASWKIKPEFYRDEDNWDEVHLFDEYGYDFVREYSQAVLEIRQGRVLKAGENTSEMNVGGSELEKRGQEKKKELLDEIKSTRYISF